MDEHLGSRLFKKRQKQIFAETALDKFYGLFGFCVFFLKLINGNELFLEDFPFILRKVAQRAEPTVDFNSRLTK
jgi:hypothetical protein